MTVEGSGWTNHRIERLKEEAMRELITRFIIHSIRCALLGENLRRLDWHLSTHCQCRPLFTSCCFLFCKLVKEYVTTTTTFCRLYLKHNGDA